MEKEIYQGNAKIHLQGQNALIPIGEICEHQMNYLVGSQNSKLLIRDFRRNPIFAAQKALSGKDGIEFASIFNQPAWVDIRDNHGSIEIELHESLDKDTNSLLWLGVLKEDNIPVHYMTWEKFTSIENSRFAFAALIDE